MNNMNFINISEFEEYRKENMKLPSEILFNKYLSKIYTNLIQREDQINLNKLKKISRESNNNKQNEINLSLNIFLEYIDIQEFIAQRIYKFLNKSEKSEKLSKNDFCEGLNHLYFGNIKDLINFTFFLADYNNDGKIFKTDMKQILSYIPSLSEFSQKNYIKQINKIINTFFDEKIKNDEIIYTETEQEINLEIFSKYIMEYNENNKNNEKQGEGNCDFLNEYDFNAPFFYFISIISYIFKNLPFNIKTVEYFSNFTNKKKLKLSNSSINKNNFELSREQKLLSTDIKSVTIKNNTFFRSTISTTQKKNINNSNHFIKEALPKIGKSNLFSIKKSGSQIILKKTAQKSLYANTNQKSIQNLSKSIGKYEYIISKKKDLSDPNLPMVKLNQKKFDNALFRHTNKYNKKKLSPIGHDNHDNLSNSTTKNTSVLVLNKSNSNDIREKYINLRQKLPSISINQKKYSPVIGLERSLKWEEEIKNNNIEEPEEFMLCEYSDNDDENRNSLCGRESNKSDNIFQLNEAYLYKHNENDILQNNSLEKYYTLIKEKELLFFSSEQKNELLDIWYINKSFISTGKESIKKQNYFTINITYENNFIKKLFFLNENVCQNFSLSIKNAIKDYNFNDYYDLMNSVGEGHFGKVYKCKDKKKGDIFAAKIIDKTKLKKKDLDLIRQEKIILNLIKHENIISLKDYFEDKQNIYFITEFYEGGDLLNYMEEKQKMGEEISEKNSARIIRKIAQGISYLNFFGIVHRDLKPENIMFSKPYNFKTLKIIDLGVCKILSYGEKAKEPIGTNGYISPEIYLNKEYSFKVDIWSLGVILYLLITGGILPFDDVDLDTKNLAKKVCYLQQEYPGEYFGKKSKRLINLLDKMLEKNENKRININNLMKDCWFDLIKK